jgi:hypothetical protein
MGFDSSQSKLQVIKEERTKVIDNACLVENLHSSRLKDVQYSQDFIIVPRFVFFPLSKWYSCNKVIERKVIKYKHDKNKSLNMFKQKKLASSQTVKSQQLPENLFKIVGDTSYELEVYPKFLYF